MVSTRPLATPGYISSVLLCIYYRCVLRIPQMVECSTNKHLYTSVKNYFFLYLFSLDHLYYPFLNILATSVLPE